MKTTEELQKLADSLSHEELLQTQREAGYMRSGFPYPLHSPSPWFYIKYGKHWPCMTRMEAETQTFTYNALKEMSRLAVDNSVSLPRVPKIFRVVGGAYVVMEFIRGQTLLELSKTIPWEEQLEYIQRIAKAVDTLLSIPIPTDATPGPYRGGLIMHPLFKDAEAPKIFKDVASLQEHVNYMSGMPRFNQNPDGPPRPTCTLDTRLYLVWGDFYPGNFIFDANGSLWIIDFENVNFLPLCFQTYALHHGFPQSSEYAWAVSDAMETELPTHNMEAFVRAHSWFGRCAFGLGIPKEERFGNDWQGKITIIPDDIPLERTRLETVRDTLGQLFYSWRGGYKYAPLLLAGAALGLGLTLRHISGRRT